MNIIIIKHEQAQRGWAKTVYTKSLQNKNVSGEAEALPSNDPAYNVK